MGVLADDTAVDGGGGKYTAAVSRDWEIWGPNGGYVASLALRAAGAETTLENARPASLTCQFLRAARFEAVDIEVVSLRRTRRAEAMRVTVSQHGDQVLEAQVWAVGPNEGLVHDHRPPPEVTPPEQTLTVEERLAQLPEPADRPPFKFWDNFESRPLGWFGRWEDRPAAEPEALGWYRFHPQATFDDQWADACRGLILVDTLTWPAATRAHTGMLPYIAPSLDLMVQFHHAVPDQPWLLARGFAPVAQRGTIGCWNEVWAADGRLVASGGGSLLCTPVQLPG